MNRGCRFEYAINVGSQLTGSIQADLAVHINVQSIFAVRIAAERAVQ